MGHRTAPARSDINTCETGRAAGRLVRDIQRATRMQYSAEEKIRIVRDGLRGEVTIAELSRRFQGSCLEGPSWTKSHSVTERYKLLGYVPEDADLNQVQVHRAAHKYRSGRLVVAAREWETHYHCAAAERESGRFFR